MRPYVMADMDMETQKDPQGITMYREKRFDLKLFTFVFMNFAIAGKEIERALEGIVPKIESTVGLSNIVRQTIFFSPDQEKERVFKTMKAQFNGLLPATSFVPQPLCNGEDLGAELWAFIPQQKEGDVKKISDQVTLAHTGKLTWAFVSGIEFREGNSFTEKVSGVFPKIRQLLTECDFGLEQLVRTWYYAGDILGEECGSVRYDVMNRIRNNFYYPIWENGKNYPASTGIGMNGKEIILDGIALQPDLKEATVIRINNPLQTNPCDYTISKPVEEKPAFSRAVAINCNGYHIMFISGTASIRESEVVFLNDIEKQTETTIENIAYLISGNNLVKRYGFSKGASLKDIQQIRVYLKRTRDYPLVKERCQQAFGTIPQIYCTTDICRPSLLVEIEAVAIVEP